MTRGRSYQMDDRLRARVETLVAVADELDPFPTGNVARVWALTMSGVCRLLREYERYGLIRRVRTGWWTLDVPSGDFSPIKFTVPQVRSEPVMFSVWRVSGELRGAWIYSAWAGKEPVPFGCFSAHEYETSLQRQQKERRCGIWSVVRRLVWGDRKAV